MEKTAVVTADTKRKLRDAIQATVNAASDLFGNAPISWNGYSHAIEAAIVKVATEAERQAYRHKRREVWNIINGIEHSRYNR